MRRLKFNNKSRSKRALSEMVSYVLLVTIAVGLAAGVYAWLQIQVPVEHTTCPDDTALIVQDYICNPMLKQINITFKNKGFFTLDGYYITATNKTDRLPTTNLITDNGFFTGQILSPGLKPGDSDFRVFNYSYLGNISKIMVTPFKKYSKDATSICKNAIFEQTIEGCA